MCFRFAVFLSVFVEPDQIFCFYILSSSEVFFLVVILLLLVNLFTANKVKVGQSCLTLCDTMDYIVHGILQARILAWAAYPFTRVSSQPRDC